MFLQAFYDKNFNNHSMLKIFFITWRNWLVLIKLANPSRAAWKVESAARNVPYVVWIEIDNALNILLQHYRVIILSMQTKDEIISYFRTQEYCLDTHLSWLLLSAGSVLRSCSWRCSCTRRSRPGRSSWWRGWTRPGRRPSWSGPGSRAWSFIIMKKLPYYRASWMQLFYHTAFIFKTLF